MCRTFRRDTVGTFIVKRGKTGILAVVTACNCWELDNVFCTELFSEHNFLLERSVLWHIGTALLHLSFLREVFCSDPGFSICLSVLRTFLVFFKLSFVSWYSTSIFHVFFNRVPVFRP